MEEGDGGPCSFAGRRLFCRSPFGVSPNEGCLVVLCVRSGWFLRLGILWLVFSFFNLYNYLQLVYEMGLCFFFLFVSSWGCRGHGRVLILRPRRRWRAH